jgi:hypothetical protein
MPQPKGPNASQVTGAAHKVGVELDVSALITRLAEEALRLLNDLSQQGLEGDDLVEGVQDGLRSLSDGPVDRTARGATSESFNLGRNLAAQDQAEEIERVIRVEVLDKNTCTEKRWGDGVPRCYELDGEQYAMNSDEYFKHMPPNDCDGRELCRGFYLYRRKAV